LANKYCNLDGTKKIKDEYKKINIGFDKVEEDLVNIIVTPLRSIKDELAAHKEDYVQHLASEMPHLVRDLDNDKTYRFGLRVKEGNPQIIYEEVI